MLNIVHKKFLNMLSRLMGKKGLNELLRGGAGIGNSPKKDKASEGRDLSQSPQPPEA